MKGQKQAGFATRVLSVNENSYVSEAKALLAGPKINKLATISMIESAVRSIPVGCEPAGYSGRASGNPSDHSDDHKTWNLNGLSD